MRLHERERLCLHPQNQAFRPHIRKMLRLLLLRRWRESQGQTKKTEDGWS